MGAGALPIAQSGDLAKRRYGSLRRPLPFAPALRKADIGIAMGIRSTEVAKESAARIITDDNFSTIVGAVEQARIVIHNILRFIH